MKAVFLCSGVGSRMRPLSDIYPKSLIPVPRYHKKFDGEVVPNLLNSIEVLTFSHPLGSQIDEVVIVASESYFKREDYLKVKESVSVKILEVVNFYADSPNLNNQYSMGLVLSTIVDCDCIMVVEGDIYLRNIEDYLPLSLKSGRSYYCCTYRNKEWVFVSRYNDPTYYEIVKGANGLAMAGLSIINGQDTIDRLRRTLVSVMNPHEFWDESLMRLNLPLQLINVDDAILEFDSVTDLINQGLYTPESLATILSEDSFVEKTDSMTNTSFVIKYNGVKSVLRLPGVGTEDFIDRSREGLVQNLINEQASHISPKSISYGLGVKITEFIEGCRTSEEKDAPKVISLLKEFHQINAPLSLLTNLIDEIKDYEKLYDRSLTSIPKEYEEVSEIYKSLISSCQHQDVVLCHRDLDPRNVLIRGDRGFLVDFEYSGLLNRYWDFGAHLSEMKLFFGTKMTEEEYAEMAMEVAGVHLIPLKLKMWRGIVDFIWSCWTIAKISLGEEYESYLKERWEAACEVLRDLDMILL